MRGRAPVEQRQDRLLHCVLFTFLSAEPPPGRRSGQCEAQMCEELIIEHSGALGCEQAHVLNDLHLTVRFYRTCSHLLQGALLCVDKIRQSHYNVDETAF